MRRRKADTRHAFPLAIMFALGSFSGQAQEAPNPERGRHIFTQEANPACGLCHTLAEAGTTGEIGPDLDERKPSKAQVAAAVRGGVGVMPAYGDRLSEQDIAAVSAYVAAVAGRGR